MYVSCYETIYDNVSDIVMVSTIIEYTQLLKIIIKISSIRQLSIWIIPLSSLLKYKEMSV